jgi:hypothetical protein
LVLGFMGSKLQEAYKALAVSSGEYGAPTSDRRIARAPA